MRESSTNQVRIVESMCIDWKVVQGFVFNEAVGFTNLTLNMLLDDSLFPRSNTLGLPAVVLDVVLKHNCLNKVINKEMIVVIG